MRQWRKLDEGGIQTSENRMRKKEKDNSSSTLIQILLSLPPPDMSAEESVVAAEEEEEEYEEDYDKMAVTEAVAAMTKAVLEVHEDEVEEVRHIQGKIIR